MVAKRSLSHWRLLSTVVIGVLLSSTVMAGTVIYFDALRELALKNALNKVEPLDLDILLKAERGPTTVEEFQKISNAMTHQYEGRLEWLFHDVQRSAKTATFYLTTPGNEENAGKDDARAYFTFNPRLTENITLLPGGRFPNEQPLATSGAPLALEAVVPAEAAEIFGLGVGDSISAVPYWRDRLPYTSVVISGMFTRNDPDGEFWHQNDTLFRSVTSGSFRTLPLYISEQMFFNILGASFTDMDASYAWHLDTDRERLNAGNTTQTYWHVRSMRSQLGTNLFGFRQLTALDSTLAEYDRRLFFSKIPMFVVMVLIAVVILYYVVTLSSLLVEQQRGELALLRSRGASSGQILVVFILEGATISVIAVAVAPILAATIISLMGYTGAFSGLSGGDRLDVVITGGAYLMSGLGGLFSFGALLIPAVRASRIGVTRHRQQSGASYGAALLPAILSRCDAARGQHLPFPSAACSRLGSGDRTVRQRGGEPGASGSARADTRCVRGGAAEALPSVDTVHQRGLAESDAPDSRCGGCGAGGNDSVRRRGSCRLDYARSVAGNNRLDGGDVRRGRNDSWTAGCALWGWLLR